MIKYAEIVISVILLFATNSINFYFLILISFIVICIWYSYKYEFICAYVIIFKWNTLIFINNEKLIYNLLYVWITENYSVNERGQSLNR